MKLQRVRPFIGRISCCLFFAFAIISCGNKKLNISGNGFFISGKVLNFQSAANANSMSDISKLSCASPEAELYKLDALGAPTEKISSAKVEANGTYRIKIPGIALNLNEDSLINYTVTITGCNQALSRPLTKFVDQDITLGSSLISEVAKVNYTNKQPVTQRSIKQIEYLIELLSSASGNNLSEIFSTLQGNSEASSTFQTIFNMPFAELINSKPRILALISPSSTNELIGAQYSVSASHWYPSYTIAYIWKLDGVQVATTPNYTFTPNKNSQGLHTIELFVGQSDGSGGIELSKAYQTSAFSIQVFDTYPATPPSFSITQGVATNTNTINIELNTGAGFSQCASFSKLAITENDATPPLLESDYNITCTAAGVQNIPYTLQSIDGQKIIRIWARDQNGSISSAPAINSIALDHSLPSVNLSNLSISVRGGATETITYSASDVGSGLQSLSLEFAQDGTTYTSLATNLIGNTTYSWTVPSLNTTASKLKLIAVDLAGNTTEATTNAFQIDSTAPAAPTATITSASPSSQTSVGLAFSSCADISEVWISNSSTPPTMSDLGWVACSLSTFNHTVSTGDGTKSIYVFAKDAVGNISNSNSVSMILDQTSPSINLLTSFSGLKLSGNATQTPAINQLNVSFSATDTNLFLSSSFALQYCLTNCSDQINWISHQSGITYSGGTNNFTWTLPAIDSTTVSVRLVGSDVAGNVGVSTSSAVFSIDSTAPTISSLVFNNSNPNAAGVSLPLTISSSDNFSTNIQYRIGLSDNLSSATWTSVLPSLYNLPFTSGTYAVRLQTKDEAGNISTLATSNSVNLVIGQPPRVTHLEPIGGAVYTVTGENVDVLWKIETPSGFALKPNGISIFYSLDFGASTVAWPSANNLSPLINGACTLNGTATGCARIALPSALAGVRFQIIIRAEDEASAEGLSVSPSFNIPSSLSLVAGNDATALGGSALSTTLSYTTNSSVVRDKNTGDIYLSKSCEILKIEGSTGKVNRWAGSNSVCSNTGDGLPLASVRFNQAGKIRIDSQGNILWIANATLWRFNKTTGIVSILIGAATAPFTGTTGTNARQYNGGMNDFFIGKNDQIYFIKQLSATCGAESISSFQLWKLEANNTVSHVYGNPGSCNYAINGALASNTMMFSTTLVPGNETSSDTLYFQGTRTYEFVLYRINTDGTITQVLNQSGSGNHVKLYEYNPVFGIPMIGQYRFNFWNPNTNVFLSNTHTMFDPPSNGNGPDAFSDETGGYYYLTTKGNFISYVNPSNVRSTVAGIDPAFGDGGAATLAQLRAPSEIVFDSSDNLYINDNENNKIRKVATNGTISTSWSGMNGVLSTGEAAEAYANYQYGITTSDGKGGRQTVALHNGACRFLCGTTSDTYLVNQTSGASTLTLTRGPSGPPNGLLRDRWSMDGVNRWVHIEEFVENYSLLRFYIYKFDSVGNFTRIAGNHTLPSSTSVSLVNGQSVSGTSAGGNVSKFLVVNNIMYSGTSSKIFTGTEGGTWTEQTLNCSVNRSFTVLADNSIIYSCGRIIYRKVYQANGLGASTLIVDLTTNLPVNIGALIHHSSEDGVIYFTVGNAVYKYYHVNLEI